MTKYKVTHQAPDQAQVSEVVEADHVTLHKDDSSQVQFHNSNSEPNKQWLFVAMFNYVNSVVKVSDEV